MYAIVRMVSLLFIKHHWCIPAQAAAASRYKILLGLMQDIAVFAGINLMGGQSPFGHCYTLGFTAIIQTNQVGCKYTDFILLATAGFYL